MKTITKHTILALLATTAMFASCYEDKGNYNYTEMEEITGDGFPDQISVVQKSDYIELNPTFTSSQNGTIDNNPNYEFGCLLWKSGGTFEDTRTRQKDINEEHAKDIKYFADLDQGDYVIQYMVTNKTTGVTTNFKVPVKVTSATYEGWMVLCDDKDGNARLDLVSRISPTRINVVTNLLGSKDPKLKGARSMYMDAYPFNYYGRNGLWYCTEHGTYTLNETKLTSQYNITSEFMVAPENEEVVELNGLSMGKMFAITDKGNIYVRVRSRALVMKMRAIHSLMVATRNSMPLRLLVYRLNALRIILLLRCCSMIWTISSLSYWMVLTTATQACAQRSMTLPTNYSRIELVATSLLWSTLLSREVLSIQYCRTMPSSAMCTASTSAAVR